MFGRQESLFRTTEHITCYIGGKELRRVATTNCRDASLFKAQYHNALLKSTPKINSAVLAFFETNTSLIKYNSTKHRPPALMGSKNAPVDTSISSTLGHWTGFEQIFWATRKHTAWRSEHPIVGTVGKRIVLVCIATYYLGGASGLEVPTFRT